MTGLRMDTCRWPRATLLLVAGALSAFSLIWLHTSAADAVQPYDTYQSTVGADSPSTQYRLSEASGASEIADAAGTCTATDSSGTLGEPGPFPGSSAIKLSGLAFATMGCNPLKERSAFTIEGWVNWTGTGNGQPIVSIGSSSSNYLYLTPSGPSTKHLQLEIHTGSGTATISTSKKLPSGWKYVAVTETSTGTLTFYVDGEVEGTPVEHATVSPASLGTGATERYIGRTEWPSPARFVGELSNIAFYGTALSAERIKAHYDAGEFPTNSSTPSVSGTLREGNTLTAAAGTWVGAATIKYSYQWWRCNAFGTSCSEEIKKATKSTYVATTSDVDHVLEVAVEASNKSGHGNASGLTGTPIEGKPQNSALPVIEGTAQAGTVLKVSEGSWTAFPAAEILYQWEYCNGSGGECVNLSGALLNSYTPKNSQVGHTLRAAVTAKNGVGSTLATSSPSHAVTASACTDEWVGTSEGAWTTSSNWSKGTVPGSSDVACLGAGTTVSVTSGANKVAAIEGEGNLSIGEGSLETTSTSKHSTVKGLSLSGGSLSVAGELDVSGSFSSSGEEAVGGSGRLVLGSGVSGTIAPGGGCSSHLILDGVTFVNEGTLAFGTSADVGAGAMVMADGAQFQNAGTFTDDSYDSGCGHGVGGLNYSIYSTGGAAPSITNTGTWKGEAATSTLVIAIAFINNGTVEGHTGTLALAGGGSGSGTYTAPSGGAVSFQAGAFSLSGATFSGTGAIIVNGATVTATSLKSSTATVFVFSGSLTIPSGTTATVQGLYVPGGTVSIAGALDVTTILRTNGSATVNGSGQLVLEPGASGVLDFESCNLLTLDEVTLRNEGTLTVGASGGAGNGAIAMRNGARLLNSGTMKLDSWDPGCGFGYGGSSIVNTGGATPSITNTGTVTTNASGQPILVQVPYNNQGTTRANGGTLNFAAGGLPESVATGSWLTENGGAIILSGGEFIIAESVDLSDVRVEGATVTRRPTSGPPRGNLEPLPYAAGTVTVTGSGESIGSGFTSATIEIRASGQTEWTTLCGPLTSFIGDTFGCEWLTKAYADGSYQLRAKLSDGSEPPNTGTTPVIATIVDNAAPSGSLGSYSFLGPNSTIAGTATDAGSGVAGWQPQISPTGSHEWSNACPAQSTPVSGSTYECKLNVAPASGSYELRALITDRAGNTATTSPQAASFDGTPPSGTLTDLSEPAYKTGTLGVHGSAEDSGSGVKSWIVQTAPNGTSTWSNACEGTSTGGSGYSCSIDTTHYADGTYQVRAEIADNVGNVHDTAAQTVTIDNGPPSGRLVYLPRSSSATITVEGQAADPISGIASWALQIAPVDQSGWQPACATQTSPGENGKYSCTIDTTGYSDGAYQLRAVITNHAGGTYTTIAIPARFNNGGGEVSSCTDSWTGHGPDSSWNTAANWSTGTVPVSSDVVCIPSGARVNSWQAPNAAGWVEAEGELAVEGSSLEITDTAVDSTISEVTVQNGTLTVPGHLTATHSLGLHGGTLSGPGQTTVEAGATGTIGNELDEQRLVNDGTLTYGGDPAVLSHGATIVNDASLVINDTGEHCGFGCIPGLHTSTGGVIDNASTGTVTKNLGGTTFVGVPFDNDGTVEVTGGDLLLEAGGTTDEPENASWHAPGGRLEFRSGTYALGATTMSGRIAITGGAVEAGDLSAAHANLEVEGGTLQLNGGTPSTIEQLHIGRGPNGTSEDSHLTGNDDVAVTGELEWAEGSISGHRKVEVASGAKSTIQTFGHVELDESELLDNGTVDWGGGALTMSNGAKIVNNGTFYANDDGPHCGFGCLGVGINRGTGAAGSFENTATGSVIKNAGDASWIEIPFDNDGAVKIETSELKLGDGETTGHTATGAWAASSGALMEFNGGAFHLVPHTHISGRLAVTGNSTVTTSALEGASATMEVERGTLELNGEKSTFEHFNLGPGPNGEEREALLDGDGDVEIDKGLNWEEGRFAGSGRVALEPGSENRIFPFVYALLVGKTLINYGHTNWESGTLTSATSTLLGENDERYGEEGELLNEGTFETNDTYGAECFPGYCRDMRTPDQAEAIYGPHAFEGFGYSDVKLVGEPGKFVNEGVTNNDGTSCPEFWGKTHVGWPSSGHGEFGGDCTQYDDRAIPAPPTIEGTLVVGERLEADPGVWESIPYPTFSYQWERCPSEGGECSDIPGATGSEYVTTGEDAGHRLRVIVEAHRRLSTKTVASDRSETIYADATPPVFEEFETSAFDAATSGPTVLYFSSAEDPPLPDGEPGSGVASYMYRYSASGGSFTAWSASEDTETEVPHLAPGTSYTLEAYATDAVGNVSATVRADGVVPAVGEGDWVGEEDLEEDPSLHEEPPESGVSVPGAEEEEAEPNARRRAGAKPNTKPLLKHSEVKVEEAGVRNGYLEFVIGNALKGQEFQVKGELNHEFYAQFYNHLGVCGWVEDKKTEEADDKHIHGSCPVPRNMPPKDFAKLIDCECSEPGRTMLQAPGEPGAYTDVKIPVFSNVRPYAPFRHQTEVAHDKLTTIDAANAHGERNPVYWRYVGLGGQFAEVKIKYKGSTRWVFIERKWLPENGKLLCGNEPESPREPHKRHKNWPGVCRRRQ
jgi:hypothetical protein